MRAAESQRVCFIMHIKLKKLEASGWMDGWEGEKAAFEEAV